ncbi:MAG: hypothetical protein AB8F78_15310 [Saprospiraceae bacterium]
MIATSFLTASLLALAYVISFQRGRARNVVKMDTACVFETRIDPPFLRPVVSRMENDDLLMDAPVVHARLAGSILVLDIKSGSNKSAEGFEIAITEFNPSWINAKSYGFHETESKVLVGPQGDLTNRLLERTANQHNLMLPEDAGRYVQVYDVDGVVTDPGEFRVEIQATLPNGDQLNVSYDYSNATINIRVPASALKAEANYQPLGVKLAA